MTNRLRRILADLIDPGRLTEIAELRDAATVAHGARDALQVALVAERCQHAIDRAEAQALIEAAELDARTARADVARLLEDAARCAHEHSDT